MSRIIGEHVQRIKQTVAQLNIHQSNDSPDSVVTRQFGFIKFNEDEIDESTRPSQYIRLALDTKADKVVQFMKEAWRLRTPDLIISITGGAKYCDLSARLRKAFQVGLVSAAATTNAWIITAGTNAGVVKEVGEALNKYRYKNQKDGADITCIGIASWGYTAGKEQLDRSISLISNNDNASDTDGPNNSSKKGRPKLGIDAVQLTGEAVYGLQTYVVRKKEEKRCDLEPNHTHFLLFDDGTEKPEHVLQLRADVEMHARRANTDQAVEGGAYTLIPIVMILVEGGPSSIQTICEALDSHTPVVVVKESGRAADLVADIHACFAQDYHENPPGKDDEDYQYHRRRSSLARTGMRITEINHIFSKARAQNPWVDNIRIELCGKLQKHLHLVTIFNFDSPQYQGRLQDSILDAVFNAAKFSHQADVRHQSRAELRLALAWHNVDYARRAIFSDSTILKWNDEDLRQGLVDALRRGHINFIELFIEYGVTLDKLTVKDLDYLYSSASIDKVLPLKKIKYTVPTRDEFYGDYMRRHSEKYNDNNAPLGDHALRDLFFWAVFIDRFDFSIYLCSKTWNQSIAPLFGARIYRKAAAMTLDSETKFQYEKNATEFDKHAASIIDRCFQSDRDFAINILRRPAIAFYSELPLDVALSGNCRRFLASKCVQKFLDNEWFGNINYKRQNINIRIFLCTLFLPLFPFLFGTLPYLHRHQEFNPNSILRSKNPNSDITSNTHNVTWSDKLVYFYRAPIVRFYYHLIFFFIFLGLFSFVLLVDYFPLNTYYGHRSGIKGLPIPITEICLHVCVWGIIFEEFRQFFLIHSYVEYLDEMSNLIDIAAIVLYLIGFVTRFVVMEEFFTVSKIVFGLDLILWYIRILHLFAAYERLGPKLIMIFNTMKDLLFFVCFILIFLFGFSITSWALITTSSQVKWIYNGNGELTNISIAENSTNTISWKLLRDITNYGVWKVFGQVEVIESNNSYSAVAFVLAILFVTISHVLLLNVLVALFNVTIQNVQNESHDLWRYQRFLLINEFRKKSLLPPPFNTLYCLSTPLRRFVTRYRKRYRNHRPLAQGDKLSINMHGLSSNSTDQQLKVTDAMKRESAVVEDFWRDLLKQIEEKKEKTT